MKNSNGIRAAIEIISRVNELLNAGLKLKDQKTTLRRVLLELANEAPAEILEAVHVALRSPSNVIFCQRVSHALEVANSALALAEQMDDHVEALEMNFRIDCTAHLNCRHMDHVNAMYVSMRNEAEAINNSYDNSFARGAKNWGAMDWYSKGIELEKAHTEALAFNASLDPVHDESDYDNLVKTVEESTHLNKVRLFCEVTGQSKEMAELMLSRSDGFLLGAIKAFTGGN